MAAVPVFFASEDFQVRDGHQALLRPQADQFQGAGNRRLSALWPPGFMEKDHPVVTLFFPCGPDFQQIPENRTILIPQISRVHGKSDPVPVPHVRQPLYADDVFSGPFKEFQVIGMVDHTGMVGVFIIDPCLENMGIWLGHRAFSCCFRRAAALGFLSIQKK